MYYIFLNADPYEHVGKTQERRKENLTYIYHKQFHTDMKETKKERKKEAPVHSSLFTNE